jgi:RNA polymerase subunit RPABC4/transcription elongation factor Spt4
MFCTKCGAQMPEGSSSCTSCGTRAGGERSRGLAPVKTGYSLFSPKTKEEYRQGRGFCWAGAIGTVGVAAGLYLGPLYVLPPLIGACASYMAGCYNWAKYKGQSPWFSLCGLIAPPGLLVLVFLRDEWKENTVQHQAGQPMADAARNPPGGTVTGPGADVGLGSAAGSQSPQSVSQQPTKYCGKCASVISIENAFCTQCGTSQTQAQPPQQQPAPPVPITRPSATSPPSVEDELRRLKHLHDTGTMTTAEYQEQKRKLLQSL